MPGLITHYLGGQSVLKSLSQQVRDYIAVSNKLFDLGTQGPDIFFYYINGFITKRLRGVGSWMHDFDLGLFFVEMARIIKLSQNSAEKKLLFAYTAGFLTHYAVDAHTHPYVFAKTYDPPQPALKEATRHRDFETSVDVLMLKHMKAITPNSYNFKEMLTPKTIHKKVAAVGASKAIHHVYGCYITPRDVYRAMIQMARNTGILQSKTGRRKRWLGAAEQTILKTKMISALTHMQYVTDSYDYLNINKTEWSAPWSPDEIRNECFLELFDTAISDAVQMIQALYSYNKCSLSKDQFISVVQNRSLKTGQNP